MATLEEQLKLAREIFERANSKLNRLYDLKKELRELSRKIRNEKNEVKKKNLKLDEKDLEAERDDLEKEKANLEAAMEKWGDHVIFLEKDLAEEREGRDDALCQTYDYIYDRYCNLSSAKSLADKQSHPLFAFQSAPGGGKSFFFDELASLKGEDINMISHYLENKYPHQDIIVKEVINMIRNSISICITYNGSSSDGNMDGIQKGLIMRILWSYFFDENKLTYGAFCKKFREYFDSLDTYTAIDSIIYHSGKSVLLCIDETMRVLQNGHEDLINLKKLLDELYIPYRDFSKSVNKFYFVVSTLDTLNVWNTQTDSQRPVHWISLRRLVLSESANLFCTLTKGLDEKRLFVINKCIADCNGHPRTLEYFYKVLKADDTALNIDVYSSLIERLAGYLDQLLGRISLPIVKIALLGNEVSLTNEIETITGKSTLRGLISSGIYINSLTKNVEIFKVIPTLSPIALQYFCISNKDNTSEDAGIVANILRRLLTTESSFDNEVLDGKPFEMFHTNWELLYRALQKMERL
ncbi:12800_t:CDS:2 [Funneliformis mosseae]|uniref:12800_t:CDS:1 n=1 Tax=Funneliformis mosseae TaxID=27381 RepID=A0A9N9BDU8_FUNMO|nr:12800_t:CDS:2 [Funneliformis mosseae]